MSPIACRGPARQPLAALRGLAAAAVLGLGLAGCMADRDTTGSIGGGAALPVSTTDREAAAAEWGRRYDANPGDRTTGLAYARVLRSLDRTPQCVAVLENVAIKNPYDKEVLAAYGKALADIGRFKEAADVLSRAHTPDRPDWSILSAQGSVADQLGDHAGAQAYYRAALKISPGNPSVMSNLGLSYALDKQLPQAEDTLRSASAAPGATMRVRQNLALVLALQGRFKEAEEVARTDLSPADATASIEAIRVMIEQSPTWHGAKGGSRPARPVPAAG